jgi:flagellar biosynthetic protein FlhB
MAEGNEDEGQEKSFEPTHKKLEDAREQGDVPQSRDVHAAASYLGMIAAMLAAGGAAATAFGAAIVPFIGSVDRLEGRILGPGGLWLSAQMVGAAALPTLVLFLVPAAAVIASLLAQQAVAVSVEKVKPKLSRLSPIDSIKQKFGPTGLVEFLKSTVKMTLIAVATWVWLVGETPRLIGLVTADPRRMPAELAGTLMSLLAVIAAITVTIGAADLLWQRYDHSRKLRMSYEDMKKESRETDGDPYMRQSRRRRAEEIATNRMLLDVPKADVVIVNPEHYAVALKWTRAPGAAPVCLAKGVDEVAAQIRRRAAEAGVPIHRDPPTARSIHALVKIGREILPEHYRAVAVAIRFATEMRARAKERHQ